jgi:hypothetical protein
VFGRVSGNFAGLVARKAVSAKYSTMHARSSEVFNADHDLLKSLLIQRAIGATQSGIAHRLQFYDEERRLFVEQRGRIAERRKTSKASLTENIVFGNVVGGSKVALGITGVIGGWREWNHPWIANRLYGAGSIAYTAGNGFGIIENARVYCAEELHERKLSSVGMSNNQIHARILETLDKMDRMIVSNSARQNIGGPSAL